MLLLSPHLEETLGVQCPPPVISVAFGSRLVTLPLPGVVLLLCPD